MNELPAPRMTDTSPEQLARIERLARAAERRIRFGRALEAWVTALSIALIGAVLVVALRKTDHLREKSAIAWLVGLFVATLVAAAVAWFRRLPARAGAVALDRHHGLSDRLASAISFGAVPREERSPFMQLAIDDAVGVAKDVSPRRAVRIAVPAATLPAGLFVLALVLVGLFEMRRHEIIPTTRAIDAVDMTQDDLDALRDFLKEQQQREQNEDTKAAIEDFNRLIDDLANKRLDRAEAFHRMEKLEERLLEGQDQDKKALEQAMDRLAEEMKKSELTKPVGDAMENHDLAKAEQQMRELANKLRDPQQKLDKQQLDQMRDALKKAAQEHNQRMSELAQKRDQLAEDVLKRKNELAQNPNHPQSQEDELRRKERDLERLDREMRQEENVGRQLDRLDQELQQAAEDLLRDMGASADDLDQGAEDLHRMEQQQMTQQEKEELRQKLQELRELLRQQGQGGQKQMVRLRRFQGRARGQSGQGQRGRQGQGQQGQGQDQQGQDGQDGQDGQQQGQDGQGQDGQGQQGQNGQGQNGQDGQGQGQGQGQGNGETWVVGPNGEKILMISRGQGSGQGDQPGGGGGQGGKKWGTGHDQNVQGGATNPQMQTQDTQVQGQNAGNGPTRSQVILGAADRGFASRGYKQVYTEYHTVAEESLNKDEIPGGYRFYVRRYFQLIRPREEQ